MRKYVLLFFALLVLGGLPGCQKKADNSAAPTGHASNEIDQPQVMYDDVVFYYWATGFDEKLPDGYECVGAVEKVDNENSPSENFSGSRVDVGQKIYASEKNSGVIYLDYENGYARFSLSIAKE